MFTTRTDRTNKFQKSGGTRAMKNRIWLNVLVLVTLLALSGVQPMNAPVVARELAEKDVLKTYSQVGVLQSIPSWSPNEQVNDNSMWSQKFPSIAVDSDGDAYAVWQDERGGQYDYELYFSYRPTGGEWQVNERITDNNSLVAQWSDITADPPGNAYAIWSDGRNGGVTDIDIYFSYRPVGGNWGVNTRVNDDTNGTGQWAPTITVDDSGNTYAAWNDFRHDPNGYCDTTTCDSDIYSAYLPSGGNWSTNVRVNDDTSVANQWYPTIAVDALGNVYAVWADYRNDPEGYCGSTCNSDIYFSYHPAGGSWSSNEKVNDDSGTAEQTSPTIAVDSGGNAYAVWQDHRNGYVDIYFAYRPVGGSWSINEKVNDVTVEGYWQASPAIAVDQYGNTYIVWRDSRNSGYGDMTRTPYTKTIV